MLSRSDLQFNMPSSLLVRKLQSPASDECRIDIATHLAAIDIRILLLMVHVESSKETFWPPRWTLRTSYTTQYCVGWKPLRKPGNSHGLEVDGNLVKNLITFTPRSWFITYNNKFVCIHCHFSNERSAEVHLNKRWNVEIKLESPRRN